MSLGDVVGLVGAGLMLLAYALSQAKRLDLHGVTALSMNLVGAALVLLSLIQKFNLAAFLLEGAWGLVALAGLVRLVVRRVGRRSGTPR